MTKPGYDGWRRTGERSLNLMEAFVQGEEIVGVRRLRLLRGTTAGELRSLSSMLRRHPTEDPLWLFLENEKVPLEEGQILELGTKQACNFHLHRCRHVEISVYRGEAHYRLCVAPATTFGQIIEELNARYQDESDVEIQITGTQTRPELSRHVGAFVYYPFCQLVLTITDKT